MGLSIGIDYDSGIWRTCLAEDGHVLELEAFTDIQDILPYVERICAFYPEPVLALSSRFYTALASFNALSERQLQQIAASDQQRKGGLKLFLKEVGNINLHSYTLPTVKELPSVPRYRKLYRGTMGASNALCTVAILLYRMRQQEAIWPEMRFLFLEVSPTASTIVVVKDGHIVDAFQEMAPALADPAGQDELADIEQAFWERLSQNVAGLLALHHFEDIVVIDSRSTQSGEGDTVVNRLSENYQFYLFPRSESEPEGFEAAIGAALIAEGLSSPGLAAEVVERLQIR